MDESLYFMRLATYNFNYEEEDKLGRPIVKFCADDIVLNKCNIIFNDNEERFNFYIDLSEYLNIKKNVYKDNKYNFIEAFNSVIDEYNDLFTNRKYNTEGIAEEIISFNKDELLNCKSILEKLVVYTTMNIDLYALFSIVVPLIPDSISDKFYFIHLNVYDDLTFLALDTRVPTINIIFSIFNKNNRKVLYSIIEEYTDSNYLARYKKELEKFLENQLKAPNIFLEIPKIRYAPGEALSNNPNR